MVTSGAGRTLSQAGSNVLLMYSATSLDENNTVLARRALVQQNCRSSCPIMWNNRTGLPDFWAAACASANDACHLTRPGATRGFSASAGSGAACGTGARAAAPSRGSGRVAVRTGRDGRGEADEAGRQPEQRAEYSGEHSAPPVWKLRLLCSLASPARRGRIPQPE